MNYSQLLKFLEDNSLASLSVKLPSGFVPPHFHITEIGRLQKIFIDCGGVLHEDISCHLQVWTADDLDHRLTPEKLAKILRAALPILGSLNLPVTVEYGAEVAAQYVLSHVDTGPRCVTLVLGNKKTDCLAPDKCGIAPSCSGPGCC